MQRKWRREWEQRQGGPAAARSVNAGAGPLKTLARTVLPPVAAAAMLLASMSMPAYANPTGGQVTSGAGSIAQSGNTMNITQTTNKLSINWQSFNIAANETVNFQQPGTGAIALNRVVGNNASGIYGNLNANGQVFLINTNGILFAPGSSVNVGGIVASTLNISDADFQKGKYDFTGNGGSVINQGSITAGNGGYVALLGAQVSNQGVIVANQGTVALGAGSAATLDFHGDGLYSLAVTQEALDALAENHKLIQANGGQVVMTARAASALAGSVLNTGVIEAQSIGNSNGIITLDGGSVGAVVNSGVLDASGKDARQTGGTVKVLGDNITLAAGTAIDVSGNNGGGTALIGGNAQGQGPEQNAATTIVASGATISADAITAGNGGKVVVWSDGDTNFAGSISAKGGTISGDGGFVETSGKKLKIGDNAVITTAAPNGKTGEWLLDPDGFTIAAVGGDITGEKLGEQLGSNNVTIYSTNGSGSDGSVNVNDAVNWSANTTLGLNATNNINVNAAITGSGASSGLNLNAGMNININAPSSLQVNTLTANAAGNINFNAPQRWTNDGAWSFTGNNINVNDKINWSAGTLRLDATRFINLNAVMSAAGTGSLVMNYNDELDTSTDSSGNPTSRYGTPLGGLNPLFDEETETFVGRIEFINNTAANPLTINGNKYTLITSIEDSNNPNDISVIKNNIYGYYALASNLTAPDTAFTSALIGDKASNSSAFYGVLEGMGNNIANLTIDGIDSSIALVGISYGVIRDLSLTNVNITSIRGYIGAIAGYNYGKIINVAATGSIIVTNPSNSLGGYSISPGVGGLVGINSGVIYGGYANVDVDTNNSSNVGGLVGSNSGTTAVIQNSVSLGNVTSYQEDATNNNAGGFAGSNSGSIFNSGATGNVTVGTNPNSQYASFSAVGGFVGTSSGGTIDNSYATGNVVLSQGKVISWAGGVNDSTAGIGGFVGTLAGGSITNSSSFGSLLAVSSAVNTVTNAGAFAGNVSTAATMEGNTYSSATSGAYGGIGKGSMTGLTSTIATEPSATQGPSASNAQAAAEARTEAQNLTNQAATQQTDAVTYALTEQAAALGQASLTEQTGQTADNTLQKLADLLNPANLWQSTVDDPIAPAGSGSAHITWVQADGIEYQVEDTEDNAEDDDAKGVK